MAELNRIGNILNTVLNSGGLQTVAQPQQQGFFEQTTPVEQVLKMIGAGVQGYSGQRIQMQEWEKKKADYYNTLREAGWSAESAANQVHKVYGDFTAPKDGSMSMKELEMESKKVGIEKSKLEKEKLETEKARGFLEPSAEYIKVVGNSLIKYDPETDKTITLYTSPAKKQMKQLSTGNIIEYDPVSGELKELTDELGNLIETPSIQKDEKIPANRIYANNAQGQRIYSDDGGITWIDEKTGQIIK